MTSFGRFLTNTLVESLKGCFLEVSTLLNFTPPIVDLSMIAALSHTIKMGLETTKEVLTAFKIRKANLGKDLLL